MQTSADSERDQKILDVTRQLCERLEIHDYKPTRVSWRGVVPVPRGRPWPHDRVMLTQSGLALASGMKARLDPEEFRPLIASELIYKKKFGISVLLGFLVSFIAIVTVVIAEFVLLPTVLPQPITRTRNEVSTTASLGYLIALYTGPPLALIAPVVVDILYARKLRLEADNSTERVLGPGSLLKTLNKIAALDVEWPGTVVKRAVRGPTLPNLRKRIANLKNST